MKTKLSFVIDSINNGDWNKAISIASKFQSLGKHRNAILDADMAIKHRNFCLSINKDPDELVRLGVIAIKEKYNL